MTEEVIKTLWPDELKNYMDREREENYLLVDVRQPMEYEREHIPGAQLVPLNLILSGKASFPVDKGMIFYCSHGMRSRVAAEKLAETGVFSKPIHSLMGGISAWGGGVVSDFPKLHLFGDANSTHGWARIAMNLEKGAFLFYTYLAKKCAETGFVKVLEELASMETAHARLIYNLFPGDENSMETFQDVYGFLPGDIIEGGQPLEKVCQGLERMPGAFLTNALDMALHIEYAAYDLYRTLANKSGDEPAVQQALLSLCQAEKKHVLRVAGLFEHA